VRNIKYFHLSLIIFVAGAGTASADDHVRVATFNISFNRRSAGDLTKDLSDMNPQAIKVATILRTVRPDIVLLNEVDFDEDGTAILLFQQQYLQAISLPGDTDPLYLSHLWSGPVNTGIPSGRDLDNNGLIGGPADSYGFGWFPGQFGMVVLSRFPIQTESVRTFQRLLWKDMPDARRPVDPDTGRHWYSDENWNALRLSSKSHWDVPINVNGKRLHILASHPTPPAFDGPEDRNGCRNADEIRFWVDYLTPGLSNWIQDDTGVFGGLAADAHFCILGDLNADPIDGGSVTGAVGRLIEHPRVNSQLVPQSEGAVRASSEQEGKNRQHHAPAANDTADFSDKTVGNLRVDFVLPSRTLQVMSGGVFWPAPGDAGTELLDCSDHRLVWINIGLPENAAD